ncbi:hypothetical protein pEaSNUABM9_00146 [Erwinia phage pEa_SNUABM_9]|nr:hypothetical protein pEaSNUABM9_00146 [Erwinia phage pEa_SNUABM_9]
MNLAITIKPHASGKFWGNFMRQTRENYIPVIEQMLPQDKIDSSDWLIRSMFNPLYEPVKEFSQAVFVFVYDADDRERGVIETNVDQFTLDNRMTVLLDRVKYLIMNTHSQRLNNWELYTEEVKLAFYQYMEKCLMILAKELYDEMFAEVSEITFRFSKEK